LPLAAALAWLAAAAPAQAQVMDSETAEIQSIVLARGAITKVADMDFGQIIPANGGTVTLSPDATPTCTVVGVIQSGTCRAAEFTLLRSGGNSSNAPVRIRQLNGGSVILTGPGGATMTLTNISIGNPTNLNTDPGGPSTDLARYRFASTTNPVASFKIGGRLNVGANQPGGVYTGTLTIEAEFN